MYEENYNFPFNPKSPEYKTITQLLTYLVEKYWGVIDKQQLYYLMFIADYIALMYSWRTLSKDLYFFDITEWSEEDDYVVNIFMYIGEKILSSEIRNGYIEETEDGYVNLTNNYLKEYLDEDSECAYLDEALEKFGHYTVDELWIICDSFNVFDLGQPLTQKSIIWNENVHELLRPYLRNIDVIKDQYPMGRDYE